MRQQLHNVLGAKGQGHHGGRGHAGSFPHPCSLPEDNLYAVKVGHKSEEGKPHHSSPSQSVPGGRAEVLGLQDAFCKKGTSQDKRLILLDLQKGKQAVRKAWIGDEEEPLSHRTATELWHI